ncbi:hypothetical protein E5345_04325 [Propionibacterium sp. NM47_B9-13]|uniref:hypothetical protein n=1 Tax=Cutibacterium modestum TaxID=2559073 RepID=UPI0001EF220E|nr:hypothetical protein [Cutibacterium modestum]EFS75461.1 hypothetical protein HMPREF9621_00306 [Cutibacterium modestum HL037PA2]REB74738.1 hypothetical protein CP877_02485 [Cutibacterium modestum]TGY29256.1 hypothetical protein E5345_04325 [Propionibacterium sp. NM47_B9-13]
MAAFKGVANVTVVGVDPEAAGLPAVECDGVKEGFDAADEATGTGTAASSGGGAVAHPLAASPVARAATVHPRRGRII